MREHNVPGETAEIVSLADMRKAVLGRFDAARADGASERTAVIVAAWAWLDRHAGESIVHATHEVRRFLARNGRHVSV